MNHRLVALLALLLLLAACRQGPAAGDAATPAVPLPTKTQPPPLAPTSTPLPPTPTPTEPLAALVNGEAITLAGFQREMTRFAAAQPDVTGAAAEEQVLNALIDRTLALQAAAAEGIAVGAAAVDARLAELRAPYATPADFDAWLASAVYTEEEFRAALAAEMTVGEMAARVTADVPRTAEQVRARYIQMDDAAVAQAVLDRARAGDDFAFLAEQNSVDRVTAEIGGDLGFFAPGSLLVPEVEAAAFALQPEEISDLIAVTGADGRTTYYIIQVTERDPDRQLTADAYSARLQAAYAEWLDGLRAAATIERFVP